MGGKGVLAGAGLGRTLCAPDPGSFTQGKGGSEDTTPPLSCDGRKAREGVPGAEFVTRPFHMPPWKEGVFPFSPHQKSQIFSAKSLGDKRIGNSKARTPGH